MIARVTPADLIVGLDVGSTTVKSVAIDPCTRQIRWSDYRRHETRQPQVVRQQLALLLGQFPETDPARVRIFITGSGAAPLKASLGAKFVQEVNAVALAVGALHPDAGSVIELGGQDAKIIVYAPPGPDGSRRVIASMNDKCASGTGATIDKCLIKVGVDPAVAMGLAWNPEKLHKVAAKCGVFAETDIVNLVKAGIPSEEILCALADAIVTQNLSVLTRGNTLRDKVVLLGGPNTYLRFLQECWRQRIPELWRQRGYTPQHAGSIEELIFVPPDSALYAAYGAAVYGVEQPEQAADFRGLAELDRFIAEGRNAGLAAQAGPPLVKDAAERLEFERRYRVPAFVPAELAVGSVVEGFIGVDGGSTSSKAVLVDIRGEILCRQYLLSKGNPIADLKELMAALRAQVQAQGASLRVLGFGATGYAADVLQEAVGADVNVVETIAHMLAAVKFFGRVDVICDVGGQDIKVLFLVNGEIRNFRFSNQCSAGNGMLLQAMAAQFGIPVEQYAERAFEARATPKFSYGCAVFLDADRVNFQKEGFSPEELLAGLAQVLPKNIWQYVVQVPRLAQFGTSYVLQGGTQYNLAAVKAQHDYIAARVPGARIHVHPHPGEAGALGAALEARRVVTSGRSSTFIGIDGVLALEYQTRNDASTVCHFCPNECQRTFIDTRTPAGRTTRYISGFSCENGTVESKEALKTLTAQRKQLRARYPNLVDYEAKLAFARFYTPEPLPDAARPSSGVRLARIAGLRRRLSGRASGFVRSGEEAARRRGSLRIGVPRVLNIYSTAPLWRTYFETLGIAPANVVFSEFTSEELWLAGAKYGAIDPCFPSKVAQSHIHQLLHGRERGAKLDYIFFPCITHLPTFVEGVTESASCPIVAGAPKVIRAAFTKEVDFFARQGTEYVDPAVTLVEPNYFMAQMFETWGARLAVTREESDFACAQGFAALEAFDVELQRRGLQLLEQLEAEDRVGLLLLGRPYHNDPGLNHDVLEEFQALGYPVISMRAIPKDPAWLRRFFRKDLQEGLVESPLAVHDVWPENYSANSVQKVWAAKFAARHPNLAVLDLSSFKCGHDAPTYGLIDSLISASGTPYLALHDLDANKPAGSLRIRVRTYGYTLQRYQESLRESAGRRAELETRLRERRRELLRESLLAAPRPEAGSRAAQRLDELDRAYSQYLEAEPVYRRDLAPAPRESLFSLSALRAQLGADQTTGK